MFFQCFYKWKYIAIDLIPIGNGVISMDMVNIKCWSFYFLACTLRNMVHSLSPSPAYDGTTVSRHTVLMLAYSRKLEFDQFALARVPNQKRQQTI